MTASADCDRPHHAGIKVEMLTRGKGSARQHDSAFVCVLSRRFGRTGERLGWGCCGEGRGLCYDF
jgi:hypothetical protein